MDADQTSALCGRQIEAKTCRRLHQSSLTFGDTPTCCSTTNSDSFSGPPTDGRLLIFHLSDESCSIRNSELQRDEKLQTSRINLKVENWTRHHGGRAVREIINPQQPSEKRTTPRSELRAPQAGGRPRHDVLTGEQRPSRRSRDKLLWEERRREAEHGTLRLY